MAELTEQQKIFVICYSAYRNATKAAKEAGYKSPGKYGWELLNNPKYIHVQEAADAEFSDVRASLRAKRKLIVDRTYQLAMFDLISTLGKDGSSAGHLRRMSPEDRSCVAAVTIKDYEGGQSVTVKGNSPAPYLKLLCEMAGITGIQVPDDSRTETEIDEELAGRYAQLAEDCFPDDNVPPLMQAETHLPLEE